MTPTAMAGYALSGAILGAGFGAWVLGVPQLWLVVPIALAYSVGVLVGDWLHHRLARRERAMRALNGWGAW